jgi:hypothetical protein
MDLLRKPVPPPPSTGLPKLTQLLHRRHDSLRTCIPGLEGTFMLHPLRYFRRSALRMVVICWIFSEVVVVCSKSYQNYLQDWQIS